MEQTQNLAKDVSDKNAAKEEIEEKYTYKKRKGTAGIYGKLYETKLLSLILFKMIKDEEIKYFYLGTNLDEIDAFDDICFKFKMENKLVAAFIQTKHRENPKRRGITDAHLTNEKSDFCLMKCFKSYLKIKQKFTYTQENDELFAEFKDTDECCFIIYTPEGDKIDQKRKIIILKSDTNAYINKIKDLVSTQEVGEHIFQIRYQDSDIDTLVSYSKEQNTDLNNLIETFKDFLNCLFFYTNAAQQKGVEKMLIKELHEYNQVDNKGETNLFTVHPDTMMLKFHDKVQKWWLLEGNSHYLTNSCDFLEKSRSEVINTPYLTALNFNCTNELKKYAIEFRDETIDVLLLKLHLNNDPSRVTVIFTNTIALTCIKLVQSLRTVKLSFIDLKYVTNLISNEYQILLKEIYSVELDILVVLYKTEEHAASEILIKIIEMINKNIIIIVVTDQSTGIKLKLDFNVVMDKDNNLEDLTEESQNMLLIKNKITVQGQEGVLLDDLISEQSKHLIRVGILLMLLNNESIAIGKPLSNEKYVSLSNYYLERNLKKKECTYKIRYLNDINSSFVVIIAEPGMGKSTLINHLSLETKKKYPNLWIVRIHLFDHCSEFLKWQEEQRVIDLKEAMTLVCNAELEHVEGTFELQITSEGGLGLKYCDIKGPSLLHLELIIHSYNNGSIIFLFDGFDEICPHYGKVVVTFIKILVPAVGLTEETKRTYTKVWITSRPYNSIKKTLEDAFVPSHRLEPLSDNDQKIFYKKYFNAHIKLHELSAEQFKNIERFFKFMSQFRRKYGKRNKVKLSINTFPLHAMYKTAVDHFRNAILQAPLDVDKEKLRKEWVSKQEILSILELFSGNPKTLDNAMRLAGIPLHMHIAANYFVNAIKATAQQDAYKKWDLNGNTYALYESFLETKFKIRLEEKNRRYASSPDERIAYEKDKKEFTEVHKKLAYFSLFHNFASDLDLPWERPFFHGIVSKKEYSTIKEMVRKIDDGEEKTGLIHRIHNNIPRFVHLVFAEYFAFEYISDKLKSAENDLKMNIVNFIMNCLLRNNSIGYNTQGMIAIFDYKLKHDDELRNAISDYESKKLIFYFMGKELGFRVIIKDPRGDNYIDKFRVFTPLSTVISYKCTNIAMFLLSCVESNLNKDNLEKFVEILSDDLYDDKFHFFMRAVMANEDKIIVYVLDILKSMDSMLVTEVLRRYENLPKCIRSIRRLICSNKQMLRRLHDELKE